MKKLLILSFALSLCFPLFSQVYDQVFRSNPTEDALEIFEPGPLPEGDLIRALAYTPDGSILAALYQHSDNVYFYNTTNYTLLAVLDVGREPMDFTLSNQAAYVCCHTSNELYIISLSDFSISNNFEVHENPCQVEIKPDETIVYVGSDSATNGSIAAYNPGNGEQIFHTSEPYIHLESVNNPVGRFFNVYTYFSLSPDGDYIIAINSNGLAPSVFDADTGDLVKRFNFGKMKGSGFSETGDTLYLFSTQNPDSMSLHRVNMNDFSVMDSIGAVTSGSYSIGRNDLAINADGTKVLTAGDYWNNRYCLFDFNSHSYQYINEGIGVILPSSKMFTSNDKRYAIYQGWSTVKFIDLETGQIINRTPVGYPVGMARAAISPIADKMACGDGPSYFYSFWPEEKFYIFDIEYPANIVVDTVIISGVAPEADITNSAVLSFYGNKIIASNKLTDNISIIDFESGQTDTLIYMKGVSHVTAIPKTNFILASGRDAINIDIIDLENNEIILELYTGHADQVLMGEGGNYAYVLDVVSATKASVKKILLNGATSEIVGFLQVGHRYCNIQFTGDEPIMEIKAALSPDGNFILVGAKNDTSGYEVNIIDTRLMEVVKTIPVNDECIFGFAFTDDSKRACVLNRNLVPIIFLDGDDSFIESEVTIEKTSYSAAYNPVDGLFYILESDSLCYQVNPENGEIVGEIPTTYDLYDTYLQVGISKNGTPVIRSLKNLLFMDNNYALPGVAEDFSFKEEYDLFIIPITGPDKICVFNPLIANVSENHALTNVESVVLFPNPANGEVFINSESTIENVSIYTLAGKLVFSKECNKLHTSISTSNYAEGAYLIVTKNADGLSTRKLIVVH